MVEQIVSDWCAAEAQRSALLLRYFSPVGADTSSRIGEDPDGTPTT